MQKYLLTLTIGGAVTSRFRVIADDIFSAITKVKEYNNWSGKYLEEYIVTVTPIQETKEEDVIRIN